MNKRKSRVWLTLAAIYVALMIAATYLVYVLLIKPVREPLKTATVETLISLPT